MKKYLIFVVFVCLSTVTFGQQWVEVVYLKNGGQVRGTIIEQVPNESLKIQTADGSIFVYKISEVEKITKEPFRQASTIYSNRMSSIETGTIPTSNNNSLSKKESYSGRKKLSVVSADLGFGVATSTWTDWSETSMAMEEAVIKTVPSQYWSDFSFVKNTGFLLHVGGQYERFFTQTSPWFLSAGLFAEMERTGLSAYFQGSRAIGLSLVTWNLATIAGVGMQSSPNTKGLHFYWKTGAGLGYVAFNGVKARGYGEAAGLKAESESGFGDGSFHFRPFAEIGFGGDSFFKVGIRYSPLLVNEMKVFSHCISVSVSVPIW